LAADLDRQGVRTEVVVGSGDRADAIIRQAKESRCGLIAMSTHGRRWLGRLAFGSVTEAVISSAQVPVLVFHPAEAAGHGDAFDSVIIL
jgi:nucleotide-binding universal stress UspA family protein